MWLVVDVIKTMAAKLMANHFHQETYFQRMQEALRKVCTKAQQTSQNTAIEQRRHALVYIHVSAFRLPSYLSPLCLRHSTYQLHISMVTASHPA